MDNRQVIEGLRKYCEFLENLRTIHSDIADNPRMEGKWSIKQIICHLYRWDIHLTQTIFPKGVINEAVTFPDHDEYNAQSEAYAATVNFTELLTLSLKARNQLIDELARHEKFLQHPITVNGLTHCPNSGSVYTLNYLMTEFIDHDQHHMKQIKQYLTLSETK
ncbi:DinB family protein [Bacillus salacetis]|uniref:DinB family protein n=1 Tax=Bacillus salacetis TaxID=2315464 RepID=A0A3A1RC19_9BACI|nr:DinB family protein [Bacillus salacetis]RIW38473.1 DinB family protein [Bacillus salacetis]